MKNQTVTRIVAAVLIALCFAANLYLLIKADVSVMPRIGTILTLLSLICITTYFAFGFQKKVQLFYKGFFVLYAVHLLTGTYGMVMDFEPSPMSAAWIILFELTFGNLLLLFVPDNLGEQKSKIIATANMCLWIAFLLFDAITGKLTSTVYAIRIASYTVCAILVVTSVFAKYLNKTSRGTK